jgi:hypothetical protein
MAILRGDGCPTLMAEEGSPAGQPDRTGLGSSACEHLRYAFPVVRAVQSRAESS